MNQQISLIRLLLVVYKYIYFFVFLHTNMSSGLKREYYLLGAIWGMVRELVLWKEVQKYEMLHLLQFLDMSLNGLLKMVMVINSLDLHLICLWLQTVKYLILAVKKGQVMMLRVRPIGQI